MNDQKVIYPISCWVFLWYWLRYWNIIKVIIALENRYPGQNNFVFTFCWKKFWILQDAHPIKKVMQSKTNELTYINHNFNSSHQHWKTINCFNSSEPFWGELHNALKRSLGDKEMTAILEEHQDLLTCQSGCQIADDQNVAGCGGREICLNHNLEKLLITAWAHFCFGPQIDITQYIQLRKNLLEALRLTFYRNPLTWVPGLGWLSHLLLYWWHRDKFQKINESLELDFLTSALLSQEGFFFRLETNLGGKVDDLEDLRQVMIDNAFLSVLVYDFWEKVILDWLLRISTLPNPYDPGVLDELLLESYQAAFLYPFRYRQLQMEVVLSEGDGDGLLARPGDVALVNLRKSGLYFSWGPRSCVGQSLIKQEILPFFQDLLLSGKLMFETDPGNLPNYPGRGLVNIPDLTAGGKFCYTVKLAYGRDYLKKNLRFYDFKGVKYYQILAIYEDPDLFGYVIDSLASNLVDQDSNSNLNSNLNLNPDTLQVDGLISPEVRGLSLAGALALKLKLPLYTIRKKNKLPGEVHRVEYDMAYSQDAIEFSQDVDLTGKKLVLVDDGIASGGTALACLRLIESKMKAKVVGILAMVNHTYCLESEDRINFDNDYGGMVKTVFDL